LVKQYRLKFDSLRIIYGDKAPEPLKNCYLKNPFYLKQFVEDTEQPQTLPMIYPSVTCESVEVYLPWQFATAILYNELGQVAGSWDIEETYSRINFKSLPEGLYYLQLNDKSHSVTRKLVISCN